MTAEPGGVDYGRIADPTVPIDHPRVSVEITRVMQTASVAKFAIFGVSIPISIWLTQPIAASLAGKSTTLNVTVAITITIALTLTNAGTFAWGKHHQKRAKQAEERSGKLEQELQATKRRQPKRKPK